MLYTDLRAALRDGETCVNVHKQCVFLYVVQYVFFVLLPYRLHLFGDGGYLLDFGPQLISLPVHHLLQLQHHLSLLPLDTVCTRTQTHKGGRENDIQYLLLAPCLSG